MRRLFQSKLLIKLIFILALVLLFSAGSLRAATSPDAIAFRVMPNSDHLSPLRWYQENIKVKGSPQALIVDGYEAVRDGRTVYVNAANIDLSNGHCSNDQSRACSTNNPCASGITCVPTFYSNIYIISYNQQAENATIDIFGQILSHWKFNTNISDPDPDPAGAHCSKTFARACLYSSDCASGEYCLSQKAKIIRDTKRLADLADMKSSLANYQAAHSGDYPTLSAGSYIAGKSISTWPSWRATLSKDLAITLPVDPINELGVCDPSRPATNLYNPITCWDQTNKKFADPTPPPDNNDFNLPTDSRAYVYSYNGNKSYSLCAIMESGYLTTLAQGACVGSAVGHAVTCTDTTWTLKYDPTKVCEGTPIMATSNCGRTINKYDPAIKNIGTKAITNRGCTADSICLGKTCDNGCATIKGTLTGGNCDCAANSGRPCTSSTANNCGEYGHGNYNCAGFCPATPPADVTITCNNTNNPNQPNCQPNASFPANSEVNASGGSCCSGQTCYKCATGYTWDGTSCQLNSPYSLNVTKKGTGAGTVAGTGINCGTDCSESYSSGTSVTLTASPSSGSIFSSWSGCTSSSGNTCSVTMNSARTVTATFNVTSAACADADGDTYDNCNPGETGDDGKPKDCDDTKNFIKPGATETCDTLDNNCNGNTDEGCDDDRDGFCDNSRQIYNNTSMCANTTFTGDGMYGDDCDDNNPGIHPGLGCVYTYCGDGIIQNFPENDDGIAEACDDGNAVSGDGCDENCQIE